jgi:hypothetical protein
MGYTYRDKESCEVSLCAFQAPLQGTLCASSNNAASVVSKSIATCNFVMSKIFKKIIIKIVILSWRVGP